MLRQFKCKCEAILGVCGALMLTTLFIGAAVIPAEMPNTKLFITGSIYV